MATLTPDAGANVDVKSYWSRTPLIWLAKSQVKHTSASVGHSDLLGIAYELVQAGADVSHEDSEQGAYLTFCPGLHSRKQC